MKTGACAAASFKLHWFLSGIKEPIPAATSAALFPATWIFEPHSTALVSYWHEVDSLWREKKLFRRKNDQTGDVLLYMVIAHTFVLWVLSPGTNFIPSHFTRPRWFQRDKGGDRKKKTFSYHEKTLDALTTFYNYQKSIFSISVVHQTAFKEILHFLRCVVLKINGS